MMENFEKVGVEIEEERLERMVLVSLKTLLSTPSLAGLDIVNAGGLSLWKAFTWIYHILTFSQDTCVKTFKSDADILAPFWKSSNV